MERTEVAASPVQLQHTLYNYSKGSTITTHPPQLEYTL